MQVFTPKPLGRPPAGMENGGAPALPTTTTTKQSLNWRKNPLRGKRGGGDPEAASRAGRAASAAASGAWKFGVTALLVATTIVSVTALIGMALTAHYLVENVRRIDNRIGADRVAIQTIEGALEVIEGDLTIINQTMPEGNGTTFFDDEWVMAHGAAHDQQFMFNASLITTSYPSARRNYALPDEDGILALLADIPSAQSEFADDAFAIYLAGSPSTRIEFDLSMIDSGATRIYEMPNKDGTLATLDDISTIGGSSNQTVFLDSALEIQNDPDTSKSAMFDASQIVGDRTYTFPNLDGVFALTEGAQTIGDKTLVANSTLIGGPGGTAQFDVDTLTTARTFTLTDRDQVLLGRMSIDWGTESMGWSLDPETYSYIRVASTFQRDRFFKFAAMGSGTGGDVGRAGIELTWFDQHSYRLFTRPGGGLDLTYSQDGIPTTNNALGSPILQIEPVNGMINFVDRTDSAKRARFDISGLTTARTFAFPDESGTLALQEASSVDTGTWVPEISGALGILGPFEVPTARFTRIGNTITAHVIIKGTSSDFTGWLLRMTTPTNTTLEPFSVVGSVIGRSVSVGSIVNSGYVSTQFSNQNSLLVTAVVQDMPDNSDDPRIETIFTYEVL